MDKLITCTVDNRWMWGLENASLTIGSPAGGSVRIDKWHMDRLTDGEASLVRHIDNESSKGGRGSSTVQLTVEQMKSLVVIGNKAGSVRKPKPKRMASRPTEWRKPNAGTQCGCGGTIIQKDHGKWIGWFCTKCQSGGSKGKK